jgi:hypothetical protein
MSGRRLLALLLGLLGWLGSAQPLQAQLEGQSFEVTSSPDSITVGDTVTLHLRLRMHERDLLFDTLPQLVGARDRAIQVFSIGRLERDKDRAWNGIAKVAYYRPGRQALPQFGVAFARVVAGIERAVLASENGTIDIAATLPPGDQPLKDIKPIAHTPSPLWPWLVIPLAAAVALIAVRRYRRRVVRTRPAPPEAAVPTRNPAAEALDRLREIEASEWLAQGDTARHYEAVANVVRDYLAEIERTPARELTSSELLRELRIRQAPGDALARCRMVLIEADGVKFAAMSPDAPASSGYLNAARTLITEWPATGDRRSRAAG